LGQSHSDLAEGRLLDFLEGLDPYVLKGLLEDIRLERDFFTFLLDLCQRVADFLARKNGLGLEVVTTLYEGVERKRRGFLALERLRLGLVLLGHCNFAVEEANLDVIHVTVENKFVHRPALLQQYAVHHFDTVRVGLGSLPVLGLQHLEDPQFLVLS